MLKSDIIQTHTYIFLVASCHAIPREYHKTITSLFSAQRRQSEKRETKMSARPTPHSLARTPLENTHIYIQLTTLFKDITQAKYTITHITSSRESEAWIGLLQADMSHTHSEALPQSCCFRPDPCLTATSALPPFCISPPPAYSHKK